MLKNLVKCVALLAFVALFASCAGSAKSGMSDYKEPKGGFDQLQGPVAGEQIAVITTDFGVIKMRLFPQYAPKAVENFVTHAKDGYYDNTTFHRIMNDFMIQGGDPTGTGNGGQSIWGRAFQPELTPQLHHLRGALAMAQAQNTDGTPLIGSQFYIVQKTSLTDTDKNWFNRMLENPDKTFTTENGVTMKDSNGKYYTAKELYQAPIINAYLENSGWWDGDFTYTVFGQVFEGMDVVDQIAAVPCHANSGGEVSSPDDPVNVISVTIETYEP